MLFVPRSLAREATGMTYKSWEFLKHHKNGNATVEITVELQEQSDHLGAFADDSHYFGDLTKEQSIDLARCVLERLDPTPCKVGQHAHVVTGPMCGTSGFVIGHVRETGDVVLKSHHGEVLVLKPALVRVAQSLGGEK